MNPQALAPYILNHVLSCLQLNRTGPDLAAYLALCRRPSREEALACIEAR